MMDPAQFRHLLGHYPTGVCIVTADTEDGPAGITVGSFTSVSLVPPLVAVFPSRTSRNWESIERSGRFCVNILAQSQEGLCRRFASRTNNKFDGIAYRATETGLIILNGVIAWLDCALHAVHEAGDHLAVLGEVRAMAFEQPHDPLIFLRGRYGQFTAFEHSALGAS